MLTETSCLILIFFNNAHQATSFRKLQYTVLIALIDVYRQI